MSLERPSIVRGGLDTRPLGLFDQQGRSGRRAGGVVSDTAYRFGNYWRLGVCVLVLFFVVATLLVPVIWECAIRVVVA
jgi:hypothetical protein